MDEDLELNRLVKSALESKAAFTLRPVRRARFRSRLLASSLLAASVAVIASFALLPTERVDTVSDVICLLSEAENMAIGQNLNPASGELLLAWQDAALADD